MLTSDIEPEQAYAENVWSMFANAKCAKFPWPLLTPFDQGCSCTVLAHYAPTFHNFAD